MKLLNSILNFFKLIYTFSINFFNNFKLLFIRSLKISDFPDIDNLKNRINKIEDFIEDFIDENNYRYN